MTKLETNVQHILEQMSTIGQISTMALKTDESVKSAHKRLDDLHKTFEDKLGTQANDFTEKLTHRDKDFGKLEGNITWLWRALVTALISYVFLFFK